MRRFLGKVGLAATCIIPVADLALSDAVAAKEYEVVTEKVELKSPAKERGVELSILAALGVAESIALGQVISRNKKVQNAFDDFDEYQEEKHKKMSKPRRAVSKVVNAPFAALSTIAEGFSKAGERIERSESKLVRKLGKLAVETGQVNAVGTSTMVMQETMAGKPPSLKRQAYLGGLITGSWLFAAEGIREAYRNVPVLRPPLAAIGRTYELFTTVNLHNPLETPVGSLAISSTVAALAYTGWKIEEFRQRREELTSIDRTEIEQSIADFQTQTEEQ